MVRPGLAGARGLAEPLATAPGTTFSPALLCFPIGHGCRRVEARLARELNVWLCTVRRDGSPHVTPVWFVYADGVWWISCDAGCVKVRNVLADPRVSLALEDGTAPVVAEGVARAARVGAGRADRWTRRNVARGSAGEEPQG